MSFAFGMLVIGTIFDTLIARKICKYLKYKVASKTYKDLGYYTYISYPSDF